MIIKRGIIHKIQMPNKYESVTVSAEIEIDTDEILEKDRGPDKAFDGVDVLLTLAIADDLAEAQRLSDGDSYVREWNE
jgi:hypothetical protein